MKNTTIICSNYNSDAYINEYLEFVNNQINSEFDIIFVDANSTDGSLEKIKKYKFKRAINKKIIELNSRASLYAAWNIGIKEASTKYVMNYNTDDMIYDYALSEYDNAICKNPKADLIYGPCAFVSERNISNWIKYLNWPEYSHEILMQICICGPFPLIKKEAIEEVGYFDESYESSGDYEMWARMSKVGKNFKKINSIIGCFYYRPDSLSQKNLEKAQQEDARIQEKYK